MENRAIQPLRSSKQIRGMYSPWKEILKSEKLVKNEEWGLGQEPLSVCKYSCIVIVHGIKKYTSLMSQYADSSSPH